MKLVPLKIPVRPIPSRTVSLTQALRTVLTAHMGRCALDTWLENVSYSSPNSDTQSVPGPQHKSETMAHKLSKYDGRHTLAGQLLNF